MSCNNCGPITTPNYSKSNPLTGDCVQCSGVRSVSNTVNLTVLEAREEQWSAELDQLEYLIPDAYEGQVHQVLHVSLRGLTYPQDLIQINATGTGIIFDLPPGNINESDVVTLVYNTVVSKSFEGSGGGKPTVVVAGTDINVEDLSTANTAIYRVSYQPYVAVQINLSLQAFINSVQQSFPILLGNIVDEVRLSWSYDQGKTVTSQEIRQPSVIPIAANLRNYTLENLSVVNNATFEVYGTDGRSADSDDAIVTFGNHGMWGHYQSLSDLAVTNVQTMISGFTKQIKTSRLASLFATGGAGEHFYYLYPSRFGLATFKKGIFEGGFVRLKNVAGTFKITLGIGDTESPLNVTNDAGYTEEFYIYMSLYDNIVDPVEPIVVT